MNKVRNRREKAGVRRNYKALLLIVLIYSNLETAQGMEEALKQQAEVSQQTLQGIQTLAEEIRNSIVRISERRRTSTSISADSSNSSGTKFSSPTGTYGSPAVSSDNDGGNRRKEMTMVELQPWTSTNLG